MTTTDPNRKYLFTQPGKAPRVISGEGTKVMLANAHPGSTFEPAMSDRDKINVEAVDYRAKLEEMNRDEVRAEARVHEVKGYSRFGKAELIDNIIATFVSNRLAEAAA